MAVPPVRRALPAICLLLCPQAAWAQSPAHPHQMHHSHRVHHPGHVLARHHPSHAPPALAKPVPVPIPAPPAPPPVSPDKGSNTGLPLPRFAALRADDVNMRSGPGTRYPILWLYRRRDLPVKIEREFDVWRLVEDSDRVQGWVHQATLVGTRTFVVTAAADVSIGAADRGPGTALMDDAREDAGVVAVLRPGVIGRLRSCPAGSDWCRVTAVNYSGWLQRSSIFGLLPNETIAPP